MSPEVGTHASGEPSGHSLLDVAGLAAKLDRAPASATVSSWQPRLIRLAPGGLTDLDDLCRARGIALVDSIERQLAELALVRFPHPDARAAREWFVSDLVGEAGGAAYYGIWVYYPWESKIVHVLPADEYFEVLTSRNQDKITRQEQRVLQAKRIGVVGLSVGAEIAVTVAQEHLCGCIVLADFDLLDLSNLNRLNAGVDELGANKAHLVARRIAKIDPYLEVIVYDQGIARANVDEFLEGLDLLIDECDSLEMKYHLRQLARARRLNVVYAADERGLLSVEPFAHAPDLAPFHGRIDAPPPEPERLATPEAYLRALTVWLGGWDEISQRSRRSVARVGYTLCGYPQLASEPRLAAGQIGHVARRLLLGERLAPFIDHLDLAEQITS